MGENSRSGRELGKLKLRLSQIEIIEKKGERPYFKYTEDISKNRSDGIKGKTIKPKTVIHYANLDNPDLCFVDYLRNM